MTTGRASAWYRRARPFADLHFYQKWRAVWPHLSRLPRAGIRCLDAGCGDGSWAAEIAARRPGWTCVGIDRDRAAIQQADALRDALALSNLSFTCCDFEDFSGTASFDLVLSICSAHYGASVSGSGALFHRLHDWLAPGGQAVMLVPRCAPEAPFVNGLSRPPWHQVFSRDDLLALCQRSGLTAERIVPCVGPVGTLAKQLDWTRSERHLLAGPAISAMARGIGMIDARVSRRPDERSLLWVMVARRHA